MDKAKLYEMRRVWGLKGGLKTRERLKEDPDYYHWTGTMGGEKTAERGPEYYSRLGKMSVEAKRRRKLEANGYAV